MATSSATTAVRSWRTAFLTLRDETSSLSGCPSVSQLLHDVLFSNLHSLVYAASDLPPHEVTSDLLFLLELVSNAPPRDGEDSTLTFTHTCHLVHGILQRVSFEFNSSSFNLILNSFQSIINFFLVKAATKSSATRFKPVMQCLETTRCLTNVYQGKFSPLEIVHLVKFVLHALECSHAEFVCLYNASATQRSTAESGKRLHRYSSLWEVQALSITMLGEAFSRAGSSLPVDIWQSTIEVLRKVIDVIASKSVLGEDSILSRFYSSLLNCLHVVLTDPKISLSDHVSGFVTALRLFFVYGLTSRPQFTFPAVGHKEVSPNLPSEEPKKIDHTPYRPPHLRKKDRLNIKQSKPQDHRIFSDDDSFTMNFMSSDSDYSDSDGSIKDTDSVQSSKVRVAALVCLQDLCRADPKSFTTQWTILLPTNDVLRPRKFEATLMTCLLFDPCLKARMASASTLAAMLDGPSTVFLQVAAISCLTAALSTSPAPVQVKQMFLEEISAGSVEVDKRSGVLFTLLQCSERLASPAICFESLQALRAVSHNYPNIMSSYWQQVSTIVLKILKAASPEVPAKAWKGHVGNTAGFIGEKVVTAAIKVLDESLRAISGFKGTEDLLDDKLLDNPFTSDCIRIKNISSAPLYEQESSEDIKESAKAFQSGSEQWSEMIEKHMPLILQHISSMIDSALHDEVASVRSAACRAIGVISCFPQVSQSAEIIDKFIHAVEINTHDPLVSVRITASWALANICDSIRHCIDDFAFKPSIDSNANSHLMASLTESALNLTKDGDKIKSNAVRGLGNLSRFVKYTSSSHPASLGDSRWLERIVQALVSCVTTGNVKVQWNVCRALSNLFLNETINLEDMDWAPSVFSILLLLLRDSSNFKIRIQAAAALAVPSSVSDYGKSFSDVVQGLEHILENLGADHLSAPSSFKYRVALQKQLTSTMLHVLSLASSSDHQPLKDFLVKVLCSSLGESTTHLENENNSVGNQKKEMISKAIRSLIEVYEGRKQFAVAKKFEMMDSGICLDFRVGESYMKIMMCINQYLVVRVGVVCICSKDNPATVGVVLRSAEGIQHGMSVRMRKSHSSFVSLLVVSGAH
ncbi:DUF4042 domain-containing protein [Citrus sinensis]|uniref:DUF4042 domain-containing protein n=1 Tax=Citrus sinensis TaxID=2711 RepID=A0ACB8LN49_CITSI|nr:DUF4042 domain-containing protein [Citrus sinensis]